MMIKQIFVTIILFVFFGSCKPDNSINTNESSNNELSFTNKSNYTTMTNEINIYQDYDIFTGEFLHKIESPIENYFIEIEGIDGHSDNLIINLPGDLPKVKWKINNFEDNELYLSMDYNAEGKYFIKYQVPIGDGYYDVVINKKGENNYLHKIHHCHKINNGDLAAKTYWFTDDNILIENFDKKLINKISSYFKQSDHIWKYEYSLVKDNKMQVLNNNFSHDGKLTYQNKTCYNVGSYSFFWYLQLSHLLKTDCDTN